MPWWYTVCQPICEGESFRHHFFMVFIVESCWFCFCVNNTSVVITERLSEYKRVRTIVCATICLSVFHSVPVCFYVILGMVSVCVFEMFPLFLLISVCSCMVCNPVQHVWLSQRDSKLSFFHTWATKQDQMCVFACVCSSCTCACGLDIRLSQPKVT